MRECLQIVGEVPDSDGRLVRRGEVRSPKNSLLCVFGQANPSPTADDGIAPV